MAELKCPGREELLAYLVGRVAEDTAAILAAHVDSCTECRARLSTLDDGEDPLVAGLRGEPAAPEFSSEPECRQAVAAIEEKGDIHLLCEAPGTNQGLVGPFRQKVDVPFSPSATLGDYALLEELGHGGMGKVYKALHTKLGRTVAVKVLSVGRVQDPSALARFEREMKAVGQLIHPRIVQATDAGEVEGTHFLAMEFVEGQNLSALVDRRGPLPIPEACEWIRQAAEGLQFVHEHGLVHRDIKPSNLMLTSAGQVKILDLGLALFTAERSAGQEMTGTGQAMGTADYMAPEQATDSHSVDIRADVYSLGCTLYKLLTGRAPFSGPRYSSNIEKLMAHVQEPVPPIGGLRPDVPEELAAVLDRMLAKDPAARFATPAEVVDVMAQFAAGYVPCWSLIGGGAPITAVKPVPATEPFHASAIVDTRPGHPRPASLAAAPGGRRRRPWQIAAAAALAVLGLVVLVEVMTRLRGREVIVETPEGSTVVVGADGSVKVTMPKLPPMSRMALAQGPMAIPGVTSWTPETRGHRGAVTALADSPDRTMLATGCDDGTVRLWEPRTSGLLWALVGHDAAVDSVTWSPDSKRLASGARDGTIRLWDVQTGKSLSGPRGGAKPGQPLFVAWSPDGQSLATAGSDTIVRICDVASGQQRWLLRGHSEPVQGLAWSPDSKTLATTSTDGTLRIWDATTGELRHTLEARKGEVNGVAFSPNGKTVAAPWIAPNQEDPIRLWDVETGKPVQTLEAVLAGSQAVAWSADGSILAAGGGAGDGKLRAWNTQTGRLLYEIEQGDQPVAINGVAVCRVDDRELLAVARQDGTVQLCDLDSGRPLRVLPRARGAIRVAADGNCSGGPEAETGLVYVVQTDSGQRTLKPAEFAEQYRVKNDPAQVGADAKAAAAFGAGATEQRRVRAEFRARMEGQTGWSESLAFLPDGKTLASPDWDRTIKLWDVETGRLARAISTDAGDISWWASLSCDAKMLAVVDARNNLTLLDVGTGQSRPLDPKELNWPAVLSPDGKMLAAPVLQDRAIGLWDVATGRQRRVLEQPTDASAILALAFSQDGKSLAVARRESVALWDLESGRQQAPLEGQTKVAHCLAFSPDGKTLAAGSWDNVILWDLPAGRQRFKLPEHGGVVCCLQFSPDGKTLASGSWDKTVRLWDAESGRDLQTLKGHLEAVLCLAFSPDGRLLASGSRDRTICLWDVESTGPVPVPPYPGLGLDPTAGLAKEEIDEGFVSLFDGKTLTGWRGDPDLWSVNNGVIVGSTDTKMPEHNTFLSTARTYKDFVLKLTFRVRNHESGVKFRGRQLADYAVAGYRADVCEGNPCLGSLAEEPGLGWLRKADEREVAKHFRKDDWNELVIVCNGPHIMTALNGFTTADYTEESAQAAEEGIIALQLYCEEPRAKMEVWFKDIRIMPLPAPPTATPPNTLSDAERAAGWRLLFDGRTTDGWHNGKGGPLPDKCRVVDGSLELKDGRFCIFSKDSFQDFELALQWRVAKGGNGGVLFRVPEGEENPTDKAPEMQLVDNDGAIYPCSAAGALFGLYDAPRDAAKPLGEWNVARLRVEGKHCEHWLNGMKVVEYDLGSADFTDRLKKSPFKGNSAFGQNPRGPVALQGWGGTIWYRDIKIRPLLKRE